MDDKKSPGLSVRKLSAGAWAALLIAVIFFSLHPSFGPPSDYEIDKVLHLAAYFLLAVLPFAGFDRPGLAVGLSVLMLPLGVGLEMAQDAIPGRSADPFDMAANGAGVLLGLGAGRPLRRLTARFGGRGFSRTGARSRS